MFFAAMVVLIPKPLSRLITSALRISPRLTSAMRTLPWLSRSTSSRPARSAVGIWRRDAHRGVRRGGAADRDEIGGIEPQQGHERVLEQRGIGGGVGARDADVGAAAKVDATDFLDPERHHVLDVALHEPLEAVAAAEDVA